jgi:translation initiation factor IF-2
MRLYQAAKKMGLSSKQLVEICGKAGVPGKTYVSGLNEEEIAKIEAYLSTEKRSSKPILLSGTETLGELASKMEIPVVELIKSLKKKKVIVAMNQRPGIAHTLALCEEFGFSCELQKTKELYFTEDYQESGEELKKRAAVVTVMGHVDHGKTTILDAIRKTNVAGREFGDITQQIGAYKVHLPEGDLVFIDTPGHEAFSAIRARGAALTDIVVLVVAADEGVKVQTVEAINHCKAAEVPVVVAVNKIDRPGANPEAVKKGLSAHGILAEDWGGQNVFVNLSGLTGEGIKELLEILLLMGEMLELKANPDRPAEATVIESNIHKQKGPLLNLLVQNGTLRIGDYFVAGAAWGKVRAMFDEFGKKLEEAGPSTPLELLGSNMTVDPGERFVAVLSEEDARRRAQIAKDASSVREVAPIRKLSMEDLQKLSSSEEDPGEVKIILKADLSGSLEAIRGSIEKLIASPKPGRPRVSIMHSAVGAVNESDILLARVSEALVFGFNVFADAKTEKLARQHGISIRSFRLIYDLVDHIKAVVEGQVKEKEVEKLFGQAQVKKLFTIDRKDVIAGCLVVDGKILRESKARLIRDGSVVYEGRIRSLRRFKNSVKEVAQNTECGISLVDFRDIQEGDVIQSYLMVPESEAK